MKNSHSIFLFIAFVLLLHVPVGCKLIPALGRDPEGEALRVVEQQPNYKNGSFKNLPYPDDSTQVRLKKSMLFKLFQSKSEYVAPTQQLPWVKTNLKKLSDAKPTVVWFGHSSVLIKHLGTNILIDPIFSGNAGPVPGFMKAFKGADHYHVKDMPQIDVVIISHDHYDHLDYRTMKKLRNRVKKVIVPIGVGSHLKYWGFKAEQIVELNWHQAVKLPNGFSVTATPARHRSNRTFKAGKTLWASYVINTSGYRFFYSGDGGYGHHFKSIGNQYGPFDLALLECGQYWVDWPHSHMRPAQTAQAAADLQARAMLPVHWAKFAESYHPWNEPVQQLLPAAKALGVQVTVPHIGEAYTIGQEANTATWWDF